MRAGEKIRTVLIAVLIVCMCFSGAACGAEKEQNDSTEDAFVEKIDFVKELGLDLDGLVSAAEGELGQDYVYLRFRVEDGAEETLRDALAQAFGKDRGMTMDLLPGYRGHEIAVTMKEESLLGSWGKFRSGNGGAKTRSFDVYLTERDGTQYLYVFG